MHLDEAAPLLEIEDLDVSYRTRAGALPVLTGFSLRVERGESVGLVGESGCGKTTVALAVMRHLGRSGAIGRGHVRYRGVDLARLGPAALRRIRGRAIALIDQEPAAALNPSLKLGTQLTEGLRAHERLPRREAHARAVQRLRDVQLPDPERVMAAYPHQLSGGQQQRVVIAMALLADPALLLLDEPTTALDVTVEAGITRLLAELGRRRRTARIHISHNLALVREICDRICVMYAGEVVEEAPVAALFARPRHPYTRGLLACLPRPAADKHAAPLRPIPGELPRPGEHPAGCRFAPRCPHFAPGRCDAGPIGMLRAGPARRVRCLRWEEIDDHAPGAAAGAARAPRAPGERVLAVEDLRKHYAVRERSLAALLRGGAVKLVKANEALTFDARRGETLALVGESGCGKSTFARVLMGLERATGGTLRHEGTDIARVDVRRRSPARIRALQMVFQNPADTLNPSRTVGAQIARVIAKLGAASDPQPIRERALRLLDTVKLPRELYHRRPHQLSGGQKQRIAIARAFAGNPSLVVADEPVSALDVSVAAAVTELLLEIQRTHRTTLLFISHDLGLVRYLADRVVVMYLGHVMERGTTGEIFAPPYHPYTEALLAAVPVADPRVAKRAIVLEGEPPSALDPPRGCPFATRCPRRLGPICDAERPPLRAASPEHAVACHIPLAELRAVAPVFKVSEGSDPLSTSMRRDES